MEFRQEMSAFVKSYAVNQFNKHYNATSFKNPNYDIVYNNIKTVQDVYRPRRYYKRKNAPPNDNETKIQITILEYGRRGNTTVPSRTNVLTEEFIEDRKTEEVSLLLCINFVYYFPVLFNFACNFSYKLNN